MWEHIVFCIFSIAFGADPVSPSVGIGKCWLECSRCGGGAEGGGGGGGGVEVPWQEIKYQFLFR